jgi:hypothetical protein
MCITRATLRPIVVNYDETWSGNSARDNGSWVPVPQGQKSAMPVFSGIWQMKWVRCCQVFKLTVFVKGRVWLHWASHSRVFTAMEASHQSPSSHCPITSPCHTSVRRRRKRMQRPPKLANTHIPPIMRSLMPNHHPFPSRPARFHLPTSKRGLFAWMGGTPQRMIARTG